MISFGVFGFLFNNKVLFPEEEVVECNNSASDCHIWTNYQGEKFSYSFPNATFDKEINIQTTNNKDVSLEKIYSEKLEGASKRTQEIREWLKRYGDIIRIKKATNIRFILDLVVSHIQSLPYFFVHDYDCGLINVTDPVAKKWHNNHGHNKSCIAKITYGVLSPEQFTHFQKGDCDSKTIFGYFVLKYLKSILKIDETQLDIKVLYSKLYRHTVLGIYILNTNNVGNDFIKFKGKKYYAWEVTGRYPLGFLPSSINNMSHWEILNINENEH
ncbi:MAG: hypothetical protein ACKO7P_01345 [Bacteroidota bacterium]